MTNKLTVEEIKDRLFNIESNYYNGWSQTEYWWRVSGDVYPTDRRLWTRYTKLLNKRKNEEMNNEIR